MPSTRHLQTKIDATTGKCLVGEMEEEHSILSLKGEIFRTLRRFKAKSKDSVTSESQNNNQQKAVSRLNL